MFPRAKPLVGIRGGSEPPEVDDFFTFTCVILVYLFNPNFVSWLLQEASNRASVDDFDKEKSYYEIVAGIARNVRWALLFRPSLPYFKSRSLNTARGSGECYRLPQWAKSSLVHITYKILDDIVLDRHAGHIKGGV